jgi:hypothetical protein
MTPRFWRNLYGFGWGILGILVLTLALEACISVNIYQLPECERVYPGGDIPEHCNRPVPTGIRG